MRPLRRFTKSKLWKDALAGIIGFALVGCSAQASGPQCPSRVHADGIALEFVGTDGGACRYTPRSPALTPDVTASADAQIARVPDVSGAGPEVKTPRPPTVRVIPPVVTGSTPKKTSPPVVKVAPSRITPLTPRGLVKPQRFKVNGPLGVVESAMGTGIEKRTPVGVSQVFDTRVGKVWAFVKVKNRGNPVRLKMVWKRGGKVRAKYDVRVGKSYGWRTWGTKRIGLRDAGLWTVELHSPQGEVMHTMRFEVKAAVKSPVI